MLPGWLGSFRARILLIVFVLAVVPLGLLGVWLTRSAARSGEELLRNRLEEALSQAEAALDKARLVAPFAGTVGNVLFKTGEVVGPGVPVLILGDTTSLRVETTDLNEVDAAQVGDGSTVTLTFDALPGITTEGEIVRIAPMASAGQGGTNFTAVIEMSDPPEALRWGMTAFVDIDV